MKENKPTIEGFFFFLFFLFHSLYQPLHAWLHVKSLHGFLSKILVTPLLVVQFKGTFISSFSGPLFNLIAEENTKDLRNLPHTSCF